MLGSAYKGFKVSRNLREKVGSLLDLRYYKPTLKYIFVYFYFFYFNSSTFEENEILSEKSIVTICNMLDLSVSQDTFEHNINSIGCLNTSQNFDLLNTFCLWGSQTALSNLLASRAYVKSALEKLNTNILNVMVLLTSSTKIDIVIVDKILKLQSETETPVPKSKYLDELLSYIKTDISKDFQYSLILLLYFQSPTRKVRLLFDIYDRNGDGFLSRSEIALVLETSMCKSGLAVDHALIEDLCQNTLPILWSRFSLK